MNFSISDKVVCLSDGPSPHCNPVPLKRGTVYVVRALDHGPKGGPGLFLVGVHLPLWYDGTELSFNPNRFRHLRTLQAESGVAAKINEYLELLGWLE